MSKIKQSADSNKIENVVAIILARGGSKGLPGKNIRPLAGKPLIAYSIEAAKMSPLVDRVIVSTDNEEIKKVSVEYGAEVPFLRPSDLAQDDTPTEPVLKHAVEWLEENEGYRVDIVVFLQLTDVFRKKYMIDTVVSKLIENENLDSAFMAYKTHKNFWRKIDGKYSRLASDIAYGPRQKREHLYREDTGLACATRVKFIKEGRRIGDRVEIIPYDSAVNWIDIHNEFDLWLAEKIISEWDIKINN